MATIINGVDLSKLNGGSHGPALPPSKRKPGVVPSTKSGVLQERLDREAVRLKETGKAVLAMGRERIEPEVVAPVGSIPSVSELFEAVEAEDSKPGVSQEELLAALDIIERATKQQAETLRKAAAERKKVAPAGEKVKAVKELTDAQKAKLAKAEAAAETYGVVCMAAISFVGEGLGESKKMQSALTIISLPALRWLAKRYDLTIPKETRSALLIREFLRVELLNFKPKTQ